MIRASRRLEKDEVILCMKNGAKITILVIETCFLSLSTRHVMELSNYYYVPNITKNIIFVSYLVMDSYSFEIRNKGISIF